MSDLLTNPEQTVPSTSPGHADVAVPSLGVCNSLRRSAPRDLKGLILFLSLTVCLGSLLLACTIGPLDISLGQVWEVLSFKLASWTDGLLRAETVGTAQSAAQAPSTEFLVIWELRFARAVLSFSAGAALGVAGLVLQSILQNPLADPFTLGVASGAAFGASLSLVLGLPPLLVLAGFSLPVLTICALLGALLSLFLVLFLGRGAGGGGRAGLLRPETLVLAGVICSSFLAALISLIKALNEDSVASIVFWIMGSFQGRGWREFQLFWPLLLLGLGPVLLLRRALDLLCLGPVQAEQLGLRAGASRLWLMCAAGALAAGAVSVAGVIGFVGLLVPHLGRLLFSRLGLSCAPSNLLVFSGVCGGLLLLWSDILARRALSLFSDSGIGASSLVGGAELPVGVITAILGAPVFCFLLHRQQSLSGNL